jgi:hypothetical protein
MAMAEIPGKAPDQGAQPESVTAVDTWSTWLIPDEAELKSLPSYAKIQIENYGKRSVKMFSRPDDIRNAFLGLEKLFIDNNAETTPVDPFLERMQLKFMELEAVTQETGGTSGREAGSRKKPSPEQEFGKYLRRSLKLQESGLSIQMQELEVMKKGYKGFIQGESVRAHVNPEQYDQSLPPWFESLNQKEQGMLRFRLGASYLAAVKRDTGMMTMDSIIEIAGIRLETKDLDYMFKEMPGFREALATMMNDIFIEKNGHLIISGEPSSRDPATGGYAIVGSEADLNNYKFELTEKISKHLNKSEKAKNIALRLKVDTFGLATAAVSAVDNFLFVASAYDSGDEKRRIQPGDANVYSEAFRAFFMPGVKGRAKWKRPDAEDSERGVVEEDFGGVLGAWILDNIRHNRNGYGDQVRAGAPISYFPNRMFFGLLDHTKFNEDYQENQTPQELVEGRLLTLAQAFLRSEKKKIAPGLYDYKDKAGAIDIKKLNTYELLGGYADIRGAAIRLYKQITGRDEKDVSTRDQIINALIKVRKDKLLNEIYKNELLVGALIAKTISPNGFVTGTSRWLLNIPEEIYDHQVYNILSDSRLFEGMSSNFRERLIKMLNARDLGAPGAEIFGLIPSSRGEIRREAAHNIRSGK